MFLKSRLITSPILSLSCGYGFLVLSFGLLVGLGALHQPTFFRWGPPLQILGTTVTSQLVFYIILGTVFIHQLINTWINETAYPHIINVIQDPKTDQLVYSPVGSLLLVFFTLLYSELDLLIVINASLAQLSLYLAIICANVTASCIVNWQYIKSKKPLFLVNY